MKIQLDTTNKVIKIEEKVNLGELIDVLSKLFPADLWREFEIESTIINNWTNPIIIPYKWYEPYPCPWITYDTGTNYPSLTEGTYNIELQ